MDPATGLCEGCFRTIGEIAQWGSLPEAGRQAIWKELAQRRAAAGRPLLPTPPPRGGD
jgi:predicted Fe-S protein YdhL (DUF1289 family)